MAEIQPVDLSMGGDIEALNRLQQGTRNQRLMANKKLSDRDRQEVMDKLATVRSKDEFRELARWTTKNILAPDTPPNVREQLKAIKREAYIAIGDS